MNLSNRMSSCHLVILSGHSPQSSPTSGASASSTGSTLISSSSAAQSGQTIISPSTTSAARVIVASHSGQFAVMVCYSLHELKVENCLHILQLSPAPAWYFTFSVDRFSPRQSKNDLQGANNPYRA